MFKGSLVGQDQKGNKYYKSNVSHGVKRKKDGFYIKIIMIQLILTHIGILGYII